MHKFKKKQFWLIVELKAARTYYTATDCLVVLKNYLLTKIGSLSLCNSKSHMKLCKGYFLIRTIKVD